VERKHKVEVWGQPQEVTVYQKSKTVWMAVGTYHGKTITAKGSTSGSAIKTWIDAAKYKGN
jgi:hypothetical protein